MEPNPGLLARTIAVVVFLGLFGCSADDSASPAPPTAPASGAVPTSEESMDLRSQLARRLAAELDDDDLAAQVVARLDDDLVGRLVEATGGDIATSVLLSYSPSTVPADEVDSLWVFSYGYRFSAEAQRSGVDTSDGVPPMDALVPGPTNGELARVAAEFVAEHPVPIIAQWEVARELEALGVTGVISVEPDTAADGTVTYLSTAGVAEKGLGLAADAGITPGHAGVICQADHAVRCVLTARHSGLTADVPEGVALPSAYDPESGQAWTRSREAWIPVDLLARSLFTG